MTIAIRTIQASQPKCTNQKLLYEQHILFVFDEECRRTYKTFLVGEDGAWEECQEAALAYKEFLEANTWVSPFAKHKHTLLANYGSAKKLARLAMSLYNGQDFPMSAASFSSQDEEEFEIAIELLRSYHFFGESDQNFVFVCVAI